MNFSSFPFPDETVFFGSARDFFCLTGKETSIRPATAFPGMLHPKRVTHIFIHIKFLVFSPFFRVIHIIHIFIHILISHTMWIFCA